MPPRKSTKPSTGRRARQTAVDVPNDIYRKHITNTTKVGFCNHDRVNLVRFGIRRKYVPSVFFLIIIDRRKKKSAT